MRKLVFVFCSVSSALLVSCSKVDTSQMKEDLFRQALCASQAVKEFPADPYIKVVLFDIDDDGVLEALVAYEGSFYNRMGFGWFGYRYKNGKWQRMEGDIVDAFLPDFYTLTEEKQKPKLIVVCVNMEVTQVYHITSDEEGNPKKVPMPEYEISDDTDDGIPCTKPKTPNGKLERIQVETLYPKGFVPKK